MIKGIYKPKNIFDKKMVELQIIEHSNGVFVAVGGCYFCNFLVLFDIKSGRIIRSECVNEDFNLVLDDRGRLNYS